VYHMAIATYPFLELSLCSHPSRCATSENCYNASIYSTYGGLAALLAVLSAPLQMPKRAVPCCAM